MENDHVPIDHQKMMKNVDVGVVESEYANHVAHGQNHDGQQNVNENDVENFSHENNHAEKVYHQTWNLKKNEQVNDDNLTAFPDDNLPNDHRRVARNIAVGWDQHFAFEKDIVEPND